MIFNMDEHVFYVRKTCVIGSVSDLIAIFARTQPVRVFVPKHTAGAQLGGHWPPYGIESARLDFERGNLRPSGEDAGKPGGELRLGFRIPIPELNQ